MSAARERRWRRLVMVAATAVCCTDPLAAQQPSWSPLGVWKNDQDGMVMRVVECGLSICSEIVGIPSGLRNESRAPKCHDRMLQNHVWNPKTRRYDGTISPPGSGRTLKSSLEQDGESRLLLKARLLMMSKTLAFSRFTGALAADCTIDAAAR